MYRCINVCACAYKHKYTQHRTKISWEEILYRFFTVIHNLVLAEQYAFHNKYTKINTVVLEKRRALTCFTTVTVPGAMVTTEATAVASWVSEPNSMICCRMFTAVGSSLSPYQKDSKHKIITVKQLWGDVNLCARDTLSPHALTLIHSSVYKFQTAQ